MGDNDPQMVGSSLTRIAGGTNYILLIRFEKEK
jgi:hypothetical protein